MAEMKCKWCEKGECWTHGQIEKPEGFEAKDGQKKKRKGGGKGGYGGPQQMMMQMMKMMQQQSGGGMASAMAAMQSQSSPDMLWKSSLHDVLAKNSVEDKPAYEATEDGNGKYLGTVALAGNTYTAEKSAPSKKAAEQAGAKAAFKALYPAEFKKHSSGKGGFDPTMMMQMMMGKGQKRNAETDEKDEKSKLVNSVQLLMLKNHGRSIIKDDMQWVIQENEGDKKTYTGSVTITGTTYTGAVCDSKKKAESSAAQAAYKALKDVLVPLEEEHKDKKRKKNQEELEKLKTRVAEKKALKDAEKAAASA